MLFIFDAQRVDHERYATLKANAMLAKALGMGAQPTAHRTQMLRDAAETFRAALALGAATVG